MIYYLYLITRDDGEQYVGVTKHPHRRLREHETGWGNIHLKGRTLKMDILRQGSSEELFSLEQEYIEKYNCSLNIAPGGLGNTLPKNWSKGSQHYKTHLTEDDVLKIRELRAAGKNAAYIAPLFNISKPTVSHICTGKTWKHVGGPLTTGTPDKYVDGITIEKRQKIRELGKKGLTGPQIRDIVNVGLTTVYRYWRNPKYDIIHC